MSNVQTKDFGYLKKFKQRYKRIIQKLLFNIVKKLEKYKKRIKLEICRMLQKLF